MTPPTAGPPPARGSRRQYAANTAAYIAGDGSAGPPVPGHGHSASVSLGPSSNFFSPADPAVQQPFFNPNAPPQGPPDAYQNGNQHPAPQFQAPGPQQGYQGQPQPVAGLANQFGQMGISGPRPTQSLSTTNLVGLPLHPGELYAMNPPEILLPPNVRRFLGVREGHLEWG